MLHRSRTAPRPLAALLAVLAAGAAGAADAATTQPTVVVTATRTPVTVDEQLASVSVIDRADIESAGGLDLVALLRREAGIDIVRGGPLGQQTSVFLRGANSNQLLVLVDGVRIAAATTGGYAWEHLPLAQIERIEIVRGPRAALYGSDAIGGVIQIFTRRQAGAEVALGVGSHDTVRSSAGVGVVRERFRLGVHAAWEHSVGFSSQNPDGYAYDPDRDGATRRSLSADAGTRLGAVAVSGTALLIDDDVEFDPAESNVRQHAGRLAFAGDNAGHWSLAAADAGETLFTQASGQRFSTDRQQLDWQQAFALGSRGEWLWGVSLVDESGESRNTDNDQRQYGGDRDLHALFASWRDGRGAFDWELASRYDDYSDFGSKTSSQAAFGWTVSDADRLRASVAEGFRAPNLNELYSPGYGGWFAGNPALGPERSRAFELGWHHAAGALDVDLRLYRNDVEALIDFSGGDTFQAINIGRARLRGAEADGQWQGELWRLAGTLGWQQAENRDTGAALLRRAPRKASLQVARLLGAGELGVEWQAASARPEFGGALPGYAVAAAWWRQPLAADWSLDLRLENLADRDYALLRGFTTEGFGAFVTLRWQSHAR